MSSSDRRIFLSLLAALPLAACGFTPAYGPSGPARGLLGRVRVDDPDGRAYEGIAVRVEQVRVTDDDPCDGEFVIEDIARVDDRFAPGQLPSPETGTMLTAVEGVLVYAEDAFEIGPLDPSAVQ